MSCRHFPITVGKCLTRTSEYKSGSDQIKLGPGSQKYCTIKMEYDFWINILLCFRLGLQVSMEA